MTTANEKVAQRQLDAYNAHDIEEFVKCYSPTIEVYEHPHTLVYSGMELFKKRYSELFTAQPKLHAELVNRISSGSIVIDHERITGRTDRDTFEAIAVYEIHDDIIHKVWFIRP